MPWQDDMGLWHWGRWSFLLHDAGWMLMRDMRVRFEARWPTTGHRKVLQKHK